MAQGRNNDEDTEENVNPGQPADFDDDDDLYYYSDVVPPAASPKSTTVAKSTAVAPSRLPPAQPEVPKSGEGSRILPATSNTQFSNMSSEATTGEKPSRGNSPGLRTFSPPGRPIIPSNPSVKAPTGVPAPKIPAPNSPSTSPRFNIPQAPNQKPAAQQGVTQKGGAPNTSKPLGTSKEGALGKCLNRFRKVLAPSPFLQYSYFHIFFIYLLLGVLFSILGSALSQLDEAGGGCYTFWGFKQNCDTESYTYRPATLPCQKYSTRLQVGAAFSILNILGMAAAVVIVYQQLSGVRRMHALTHKRNLCSKSSVESEKNPSLPIGEVLLSPPVLKLGNLRYAILGVVGACFIFQLICIIVIITLFSERPCQSQEVLRTTAYGSGFGLLLLTWVMTVPALCMTGIYILRFS